jgi:transposase
VSGVIIGVDPHKVSATIEVLGDGEQVLKTGRFGTDRAGYRAMLAAGRAWPERTWAVEGCQGIGRHVAQRLLADRREELANARTQAVSRLHRLLPGLIPGGAPRFLSAAQARALLATVRPREIAGRTRRQIAAELLAEIVLDRKLKDSDKALRQAVAATGTALMDLHGLGRSARPGC